MQKKETDIYESPATLVEAKQSADAAAASNKRKASAEPTSPGSQHPQTRTLPPGPDPDAVAFQNVSFQKMQHAKAKAASQDE